MTIKNNLFVLVLGVMSAFSGLVCGQEFVLGGIGRSAAKKAPKPNPNIKTAWGEEKNGMSLRIDNGAKSRWGMAEPPTFLLQIKNLTEENKEIAISQNDLSLHVNGKSFVWNSPGTKIITSLKPKETKLSFFILRLDANQWRSADAKDETTNTKLSVLDVGKKEFEVKLRIGKPNENEQLLSTGKIQFEVTQSVFELPTVGGVLLGTDGKPLAKADIYLCKDAQFSIYYSSYNGKWFSSKSVSHYDPFGGGFSSAIKPVKTNEKGEFAFSPGFRDKRIVVLPPVGSAQVFDLPTSFSTWKVQLRKTGSLLIEHDIDGETATANASVTSSRFLATTENKQTFMLTESFNVPLTNGKKYEIKNMSPNRVTLNRYKYVRVGNRSYSIGRMNRSLTIEEGKQAEFRMVRKTGQKISFSATKIPSKVQYVVASIFEMDEPINTQSIYSNQTVWSDASAKNEKKIDFKSCLISPGTYRLVVMSVPPGKTPNQSTYKPDHVGSKIIEVKKDGTLNAGEIRLFPVKTWMHNSGMALDIKLVTMLGTSPGARTIWPVNIGYKTGFNGTEFRTNGLGLASVLRPSGRYRFATGLDQFQTILFDVSVPRMTPQSIIMEDKPTWVTEDSKKLKLKVTAQFDARNDKFVVDVQNDGDQEFSPRLGDVQILMQSQLLNKTKGIRFVPDEGSRIYEMVFKPKTKTRFEISRAEMLESGLCVSASLNLMQLANIKEKVPEKMVFAGIKFATAVSNHVFVPELPPLPPKPFR